MGTMLSIDWDFFTFNRAEAGEKKIQFVNPVTGEKSEVSVWMLYDWGHTEKHPAFLSQVLWMSRYAAFRHSGIDPIAECKVIENPSPELFAHALAQRFQRMEYAPLWISDSHSFGIQVAQQAVRLHRRRLDRIVHFDAHHDLGYDDATIKQFTDKGLIDCGTWLLAALDSNFVHGVDVVYPNWRKVQERRPDSALFKKYKRRVRFYSYDEWKSECKMAYTDVRATHLCRSSAWTPPWLDERFEKLIRSLQWSETICFDCLPGGQKIGAFDACHPRSFSVDEAENYVTARFATVEAPK